MVDISQVYVYAGEPEPPPAMFKAVLDIGTKANTVNSISNRVSEYRPLILSRNQAMYDDYKGYTRTKLITSSKNIATAAPPLVCFLFTLVGVPAALMLYTGKVTFGVAGCCTLMLLYMVVGMVLWLVWTVALDEGKQMDPQADSIRSRMAETRTVRCGNRRR